MEANFISNNTVYKTKPYFVYVFSQRQGDKENNDYNTAAVSEYSTNIRGSENSTTKQN